MNQKWKKVVAVLAIVVGALKVLSGTAPMIIGVILKAQVAESVGVIGGADGPTAIFVAGVTGTGSVVLEIVVGVLLIIVGIWGYRRSKN